MNVVFLFRRLVFIQVLLGIVAFCMAEPGGNPGLMLIAGTLTALSWYVVEGPAGRPLPQWVLNVAALFAVAWLSVDMVIQQGQVIIAMGHFTMWLQILQLYGKKSNREYGLILVLSMLQMVGASILSVNMVFGLLLALYCVVALFTILLFQFKTISDEVAEANQLAAPVPVENARPKAVTTRGYRWQFRGMAVLIGAICGLVAAVLFITLPRTSRFTDLQISAMLARAQTGFSSQVQLGGLPPGEGSREVVLNMTVTQQQPYFLLRGASLDRYNRHTQTWSRGRTIRRSDVGYRQVDGRLYINCGAAPEDGDLQQAQVTLRQGRHQTLFTIYPTMNVQSTTLSAATGNRRDQHFAASTTTAGDPQSGVHTYNFRYLSNHSSQMPFERFVDAEYIQPDPEELGEHRGLSDYGRGWIVEPELVRGLALQILRAEFKDPELDRDVMLEHDPRDFAFAGALERHLQQHYSYSLDFVPSGKQDPIIEFLTISRQGHCELFASALAAMTRSLGMRARVVTGFRVSEYNSVGSYYIAREKHAHAWTEIDCGRVGWQTFDATPPAEVAAIHATSSNLLTALRDLYEHLEFTWLNTLVTYDRETRSEVLSSIGQKLSRFFNDRSNPIGAIVGFFSDLPQMWKMNAVTLTITAVILIFILVGVVSLVRRALVHRRRLAALQLTKLPHAQRRGLVARLRFYLQMLDMLERHGHVRPPSQSPLYFAQGLVADHPGRFVPVINLTQEFYEIRFGLQPLDDERRDRIRDLMKSLEDQLLTKA
ncbi:MAG: transglutaminaseTgpA domain-containing protein [Phycisphaeraceae bacterium]